MFVSVTRLRLRSWRFLPFFMLLTSRTGKQVRGAAGYRTGSLLLDRRLTFWTLTGWTDEAAMRAYMLAGPHRTAMPKLVDWCDEASVVHWTQESAELPPWPEAVRRMREDGRPSKVRYPSPGHAALDIAQPRTWTGSPLHPDTRRQAA